MNPDFAGTSGQGFFGSRLQRLDCRWADRIAPYALGMYTLSYNLQYDVHLFQRLSPSTSKLLTRIVYENTIPIMANSIIHTKTTDPVEAEYQDTTLRARAQAVLRNAILDGHFVAGQKLVERELSLLTGASRSILREALVHLEANGLIERRSYSGFSVTRLSARKVHEIFELRATVETLAAELFTERASDQEISDLSAALLELEDCLINFDLARMRAAKEGYYEVLFTGCRNIEIRRALGNVIDRIYYLRSQLLLDPDRRHASLAEMRRLTTALVERDRLAVRAASLAHISAAREALLNSMVRGDDGRAPETGRTGRQ